MFKALQELARKSTLLLSVAPEGDLMRVNITPVSKSPDTAPALRALSLLASADELDRDFAQAMQMWSAPRRTLLDQVAGALEQEDAEGSTAYGSSGKADKQVKGSPKGEKQSKNTEQVPVAKPTEAAPSGEAPPKREGMEQQPGIAADAPIPATALDKDWQTKPASNQPPPVPDSEAGKAISTPTPAAQSGGTFSDIEF